MSLLKNLEKVYDFHVNNAWCKGQSYKRLPSGRAAYCLVGAIDMAIAGQIGNTYDLNPYTACYEAAAWIERFLPEGFFFTLAAYNDHRKTRKRDITTLLRTAIEAARKEQQE